MPGWKRACRCGSWLSGTGWTRGAHRAARQALASPVRGGAYGWRATTVVTEVGGFSLRLERVGAAASPLRVAVPAEVAGDGGGDRPTPADVIRARRCRSPSPSSDARNSDSRSASHVNRGFEHSASSPIAN